LNFNLHISLAISHISLTINPIFMQLRLPILALLLCGAQTVFGQVTATGKVTDDKNNTLIGVTVFEQGTFNGSATGPDGTFSVPCKSSNPILVFSYVGFATQEAKYDGKTPMTVVLLDDNQVLKEVVISVGSRANSRTLTTTPLPVDNLTAQDFKNSGQISFNEVLQYKVPSFNSVNLAVQDATSLLDPYELRNLGPSRTLLLINGKRKNMSALVYIQNTAGKGETGADLAAIPTGAIKRIEILRDGASAQYGSDAIAGVMNVILKDKIDYSELTLQTGIYTKGDGLLYGANLNTGTNLGEKGFINFNIGMRQQDRTNRAGKLDKDREFSDLYYSAPSGADSLATVADNAAGKLLVNKYLDKYPDGRNVNGSPAITSATFGLNGGVQVNEHSQVYFNGAFAKKRVFSYANSRTPYWKKDYGLLHTIDPNAPNYTTDNSGLYNGYVGYIPTFDGDLTDANATIGYMTETATGWKVDMSATTGMNEQQYSVDHTVNHDLAAKSPTSFRPGGYGFSHNVGNLDISKSVSKNFGVAFGAEFRNENFEIFAGDAGSTYGGGSNSFPGIQADKAGKFRRFNMGAYVDLAWDITPKWLLNGTVRGENYSDFGPANVYKVSSRYLITDAITVRGSFSTGFKAPTLHQINLDVTQATFANGNIVLEGIAPNTSPYVLNTLGVPKLTAEKSTNFTAGIGLNPMKNLSITIDYYNITIRDRILLSSRIKIPNADPTKGASTVSFFINGIDTRTSGIDFVANWRKIKVGEHFLGFNLAANMNGSVLLGTAKTPAKITALAPDATIFNATEQSIALTSRPAYKAVLGVDYNMGKFSVALNNTLMGPAIFRNADLPSVTAGQPLPYLQFDPKVLTDLVFNYNFNEKFGLSLSALNLLGVIPSYTLHNLPTTRSEADVRNDISLNGRYWQSSYDASHFSINGTNILLQANIKF
jgi:iron complex outermembrane recepter protein